MPRADKDFSAIYGTERVILSFDFTSGLAAGETISLTPAPAVSALLVYGIDANPMVRLIGTPVVVGPLVLQEVGIEQPGAVYNFIVTVTTSAGQTLTVNAHQSCLAVQ